MAQQKTEDQIQTWIQKRMADYLEVGPDEIGVETPLANFGLGSRDTSQMTGELEEWLELRLSQTVLYEYEDIKALSSYLAGLAA